MLCARPSRRLCWNTGWFIMLAGVALLPVVSFAKPPRGDQADTPKAPTGEKVIVSPDDLPNEKDNLLPNGSFDTPAKDKTHPAHWQAIDNLVFFWEKADDPERGRIIRIDTDVNQGQAYQWWIDRFVHDAPLDKAPNKRPTQPPKYNTVAGLEGGFYWSDYIPVKPGAAYRVYVDAKGPASKVFIRGYEEKLPLSFGDEHPAVQEQFRNARGEPKLDKNGRPVQYHLRYLYTTWFPVGGSDEWKTYTHHMPRHPNNNPVTEDVRYIRIMIYPYWPPGEYYYDNVRVVEVKQESKTQDTSTHD